MNVNDQELSFIRIYLILLNMIMSWTFITYGINTEILIICVKLITNEELCGSDSLRYF